MNTLNDPWREKLPLEKYKILREKETEAPFSGEYYLHNKSGYYCCGACGVKLFSSEHKYDSGCGWPSFYDALEKSKVKLVADNSHNMKRTEVVCSKCDSHLGHLFDDGPEEKTGLRYCINSGALDFEAKK